MIRTVVICITIGLFFLLTILLWPIEWVIGKISPRVRDISRLRILQGYFRIVLFLSGTRVTWIGREKIPRDRPVLYIINHRSLFDVILTYVNCPDLTGYIAKKEFMKVPLLSWWIRWLYGFFLDRENLKEGLKVILGAIDHVKNGISIAIFPEGTRSRSESELDMLPFHEGSFKIAVKTGCPIVPVSVSGSSAIFEEHAPWIHSARVVVEYGDPILPEQLSGDDKKFIGRYVQGIMHDTLIKNAA